MSKLPKWMQVLVFIGILFVGLLTGILSWFHGHEHALYLGESAVSAILIPFVPDVSMLISIFIRRVLPRNGWARAGMMMGIAVTIWMNLSNIHVFPGDDFRTVQSGILSLVPPMFLFVCIEMAFSIGYTAEVAKEARAEAEKADAKAAKRKAEDAEKARRAAIAQKGWATRKAMTTKAEAATATE